MNNDLISRSALEAKAKTIYMEINNVAVPTRVISIADLHLAPTVDAVEVVRCNQCVYKSDPSCCPYQINGFKVPFDWYCPMGVKAEEGSDVGKED